MSHPPSAPNSAPSSTPGTPRSTSTGSSGGTTPIHTIVQNLPNLFQMYDKGTLSDTQISQLRQLMNSHVRQITANALHQNRPNPLYSLPDAINPCLPWKGQPALVTREAFEQSIKAATKHLVDSVALAARRKAAAGTNQSQVSSMSGDGGVGTPGATLGLGLQRGGTPISAASSPMIGGGRPLAASSPAPQIVPQQINHAGFMPAAGGPSMMTVVAPTATGVGPGVTSMAPTGPAGPTPMAPRPRPPPGLFSHADLTQLAKLTPEARNAWLQKDPQRQQQFSASLQYWRAQPKSNFNPANRPPQVATPGRPPNINNANKGPPNPSSVSSFATALPDARGFALRPPPSSAPVRPPPTPPEPEPLRRKRQLHQMLGQIAPGLALEVGVDNILSEIMDRMLEQGLEGAVRMAKHRGGDKVELKDMARYIDYAWEMTVPGFDAAPSHNVHAAPDKDKKKGRTVAPRAATKLTKRDDE
ncbi:hypothetical protein L204_104873 [Cryptococcus depauperatus]|nr:hypothetical protein L204_05382 [Cryptococcus depauperatus CBS 7855]